MYLEPWGWETITGNWTSAPLGTASLPCQVSRPEKAVVVAEVFEGLVTEGGTGVRLLLYDFKSVALLDPPLHAVDLKYLKASTSWFCKALWLLETDSLGTCLTLPRSFRGIRCASVLQWLSHIK